MSYTAKLKISVARKATAFSEDKEAACFVTKHGAQRRKDTEMVRTPWRSYWGREPQQHLTMGCTSIFMLYSVAWALWDGTWCSSLKVELDYWPFVGAPGRRNHDTTCLWSQLNLINEVGCFLYTSLKVFDWSGRACCSTFAFMVVGGHVLMRVTLGMIWSYRRGVFDKYDSLRS